MRDGTPHQNNNPEVDVDVRHPNLIIEQQILQLKIITSKLRSAYNGHDVDWIDTRTCTFEQILTAIQLDILAYVLAYITYVLYFYFQRLSSRSCNILMCLY